jgi:hypothetical protein
VQHIVTEGEEYIKILEWRDEPIEGYLKGGDFILSWISCKDVFGRSAYFREKKIKKHNNF